MEASSGLGAAILDFASRYGVYGLSIGMFAESLGVPYGSAVLIFLAGTLIKAGKVTYFEAVMLSTIGLILGSFVSYFLGYIGKIMGKAIIFRNKETSNKKPGRIKRIINRYGYVSIFLAQLFGTTRTFVSIPAGAMEMNLLWFLVFTALGGLLFCAVTIGFSMVLTELFARFFNSLFELPYFPVLIIVFSGLIFLLIRTIWLRITQYKEDFLDKKEEEENIEPE